MRFDERQLTFLQPDTLAALANLRAVQVRDLPITGRHIELLAQIESLEYLELQTLDLPASLQPLSSLPRLRTVVISGGPYVMTDQRRSSPFRREVLSQLDHLPALQQLVLKPPYMPGIGFYGGIDEPDPASDPILKRNAAEIFRGHTELQRLWIGANQREQERADLQAVSDALPHTDVSAATYDSGKAFRVIGVASFFSMAVGILLLQLISQFSSPASQLIPGFARLHLGVAALLVLFALLAATMSLRGDGISIPAALAVLLTGPAAIVVFNDCWNRMMKSSSQWVQYVPATVVLGFMLMMLWASRLPPSFHQRVDQFLIGYHPLVASVILAGAAAVSVGGLLSFTRLHRQWAEQSLEPAMTLRELNERSTSLTLRGRGDRYLVGPTAHWERELREASLRLRQGSWLALCRMWQLGNAPTNLVRVVLISAVLVFAISYLVSSGSTHALHLVLWIILWAGMQPIAMSCIGRRSALPLDFLHPASRRDLVTSAFAAVFAQVAVATGLALLFAWIYRTALLDVPSVASLVRGAVAMGALAVLITGTILWVTLHHRIILVVAPAVMSLVAMGLVCLIVIDRGIGPTSEAAAALREVLHHGVVLPGLWLVAIAMLGSAFILWMRAEFAGETRNI